MNATDLAELSTALSAIEDWLRESCSARHADDMADRVHEAWRIIDGLADVEEDRSGDVCDRWERK